jgi:hypothetical protein
LQTGQKQERISVTPNFNKTPLIFRLAAKRK